MLNKTITASAQLKKKNLAVSLKELGAKAN
jgi:hypothetical protein